jgi:hypothetical protein
MKKMLLAIYTILMIGGVAVAKNATVWHAGFVPVQKDFYGIMVAGTRFVGIMNLMAEVTPDKLIEHKNALEELAKTGRSFCKKEMAEQLGVDRIDKTTLLFVGPKGGSIMIADREGCAKEAKSDNRIFLAPEPGKGIVGVMKNVFIFMNDASKQSRGIVEIIRERKALTPEQIKKLEADNAEPFEFPEMAEVLADAYTKMYAEEVVGKICSTNAAHDLIKNKGKTLISIGRAFNGKGYMVVVVDHCGEENSKRK